eukprot:TRINITY_DN13950_c0_g1_i1.p1 TRINITY_DN13950_c0_g1~~TRINITY_DN13950_c0_g1_i1.p1  ORF type:complete len:503 (+),score=71.60 TRINITY_DN13950_c0_g1_i1:2798-4306(+)
MGQQLLLNLSPSAWNVIKWALFTFVITPAFELVAESLMTSSATVRAQKGAQLELFDSRLGIFALHSRYAGKRHTRLWLMLGAAVLVGMELWLEMSFSTAEVAATVSEGVWVGPDHSARYMRAGNVSIEDEPTRFLEAMGRQCIEGPRAMRREPVEPEAAAQSEGVEVIGQYMLTANWTVRAAYMREEDRRVACDADAEPQWASMQVPNIVMRGGAEGFNSKCVPALDRDSEWFPLLYNASLTQLGAFSFDGMHSRAFRGPRITCVELPQGVGETETTVSATGTLLCAMRREATVALVLTSGLRIARCEAMRLIGPGVAALVASPARQLRLLAFVAETRILQPGWNTYLGPLVLKRELQRVALAALMASAERGVGGVEARRERRRVTQRGGRTRQTVTMDVLAAVPLAILAALGSVLAATDLVLRMHTMVRQRQRLRLRSPWLARVAADDLRRIRAYSSGGDELRLCLRLQWEQRAMRVRVLPSLPTVAPNGMESSLSSFSNL